MTADEYAAFYHSSFEHHVEELILEEKMSEEEAKAEAKKELLEMLPNGPDTADNCLMAIKRKAGQQMIGYIWTLYEFNDEIKQCFLCDFMIEEAYRRHGYGTQALFLTERIAKEQGCREIVLFAANANRPAEALYRKCGYQVRKPYSYGKYMFKAL